VGEGRRAYGEFTFLLDERDIGKRKKGMETLQPSRERNGVSNLQKGVAGNI